MTREELLTYLDYDAETGIFRWKVSMRRGTIQPGDRAGSDIGEGWISIKIGGRGYNAGRLAWWFVHNEYPEHVPIPLNGVRSDLRISNLEHYNEYQKKFKIQITHKELRRILHYDPITGVFIWKLHMSSRAKPGDIAGTIQHGYTNIRIYGRGYKAGRLAWFYTFGVWPTDQIDHKNRSRSHNSISNLRDVTAKINCANRTPKEGKSTC